MPRPKKKARDLTTEEAMKKLFSPEVREKLQREAQAARKRPKQTPKNTTRPDNIG